MIKFIELDNNKTIKADYNITYSSLDNLENAGLLLNESIIVVSFYGGNNDSNYNEQKIIDYLNSNTLNRNNLTLTVSTAKSFDYYYSLPKGMIIDNSEGQLTVGGFQVNYKTGDNSYGVVKENGTLCKTSKELVLEGLPELPDLLYPLKKTKQKLSGMTKDNDIAKVLFDQLCDIKTAYENMDISEVIKIALFINYYIFTDSLNPKDFDDLLIRFKLYEKEKMYNGDSKDMIEFANFLVKELDIKIYNYEFYFKDGNHYSKDRIKLNKAINKYLPLKKAQYTELEHQLYTYANIVESTNNRFKIKLRNGVISEHNVIDIDYGFTPFFLDITYNPNAKDEEVDKFLDFVCCGKPDMRQVVEEILGHCLLVTKAPHKLYFLTGRGSNGKSTFVEMITNWLGNLSSHIDIENFDDGTSLTSLNGKLANIADDINAVYLEKSKYLKTLASGNTVSARAIYKFPVDFRNTATLIFTANEPPVFRDKSHGLIRRLVIVPFENVVSKCNPNMDELLSSETAKSYLLNLALAGVKRIYENKLDLSPSETIKKATDQYHIDNDSVRSYLNEKIPIGRPFAEVYREYCIFCNEENLKPITQKKFSMRLKDFGFISVNERYYGDVKKVVRNIFIENPEVRKALERSYNEH